LTIAHVSLRKQFGQPLSSFQGVQFQLTDAEVERSGVEILAK
jgi:alkylation response protein AidB-like acyl-CoA dehydrogenase